MEAKLYNGEITIQFNENSHSYYKDGKRLKSVTSIVNMLDNPQLTYWKLKMAGEYLENVLKSGAVISSKDIQDAIKYNEVVAKDAADIGSKVHNYCEKFALSNINGDPLPDIPEDMDYKMLNGINAFLEWFSKHNIKFIKVENIIYSKKYDYVGKFDALAEIDGELTLIDYKTSKGIYNNQDWQLCGYKVAYEEEFEDVNAKPLLLHFDKETGIFTPHYVEDIENKTEIFKLMAQLKNLTN